jgi:hypothetical protein
METYAHAAQRLIQELLREGKPEESRHWAIAITEAEKLQAYITEQRVGAGVERRQPHPSLSNLGGQHGNV